MIDFSPLWATMDEKGISQYRLLTDKVIDNKTLDGIKHNHNITLLTLEKLCRALDCTPNDIVRFVEEPKA
ncbi:MAG: helix-turn-helix transcriptional regulator [Oscillibacter sp.]|nr:helix-turn-helix transcriptional regulator [Oscillibacter sp.]MBD5170361.1 helix-turn-helix transcriptional regulator [Oscillibacter sp.]